MSLAPLDLIAAHPWRRVAFTTYALSLSFFEAVVLDALVRGGGREALILADLDGVRASLGEQGARRVGKDYELEPVAVSRGVFHAKITVLSAPDECHLLVGSGNLTFGGWGGNVEVLEHLHPGFAADAIEDAAGFFDLLPLADRVRVHAGESCEAIAAGLRAAGRGRPRNGDVRLFHNLEAPIATQLLQTVDDLGGAVRLTAAAPFWDDGSAVDRLCAAMGLDHVFVHAHAHGSVEGTAGANWPSHARSRVHAVRLEVMDEAAPRRRLHAKAFEVMCKRGRVLVSGSANGTSAALGADRNIEACVARIQRERLIGWRFADADPPPLRPALEDAADSDDNAVGVLRAVLEGDDITGVVLTPAMSGSGSIYQVTTEGPEILGQAALGPDGAFRVSAPGLEVQSWKGGRLVIRVESESGQQAEGFVSVAGFAELTRRAGALGPRLLAVLAGTETPADVAAIMSWFHDDPRRLMGTMPMAIGGGAAGDGEGRPTDAMVAVAELNSRHAVPIVAAATIADDARAQGNWSRFMDHVFAAFRERRGSFGQTSSGRKGEDDDDDNPDRGNDAKPNDVDPAVVRSLAVFERLFEVLLSPGNAARHALVAFDLTQYVCERLQPEAAQAKAWLERLVDVLASVGVPPDRRNDAAAAVLTLLGMRTAGSGGDRGARLHLLRLGVDMAGAPPLPDGVLGFQSILHQTMGFADLWERVKEVRTYPEQVQAYLRALDAGQPSGDYAELADQAREEWPILESAFTSERARQRLLVMRRWEEACPRCHRVLPAAEIHRLRSLSLASAKNCCGRIMLWPGA